MYGPLGRAPPGFVATGPAGPIAPSQQDQGPVMGTAQAPSVANPRRSPQVQQGPGNQQYPGSHQHPSAQQNPNGQQRQSTAQNQADQQPSSQPRSWDSLSREERGEHT